MLKETPCDINQSRSKNKTTILDYLVIWTIYVTTRTSSAHEDNEPLIKPINEGRSPTMRHVSRTHRVDQDLLYDRINLDQPIKIKYVNTTQQLQDILTKGTFTKRPMDTGAAMVRLDETSHFCTYSNLIVASSIHSSSPSMSNRAGDQFADKQVSAKSKPIGGMIAKTIDDQKADDACRTDPKPPRASANRVREIRIQQELDSSRTHAIELTPRSIHNWTRKRGDTHGEATIRTSARSQGVQIQEPSFSVDSKTLQKSSRHRRMKKNKFAAM